jgi:hemerythrin-like domain-containing protein
MLADHEAARDHVRQVIEAVDRRDADQVIEHLSAYGELLSGHIKREDEILYPWMDRELTTTQVGELFSKFAAVDRAVGPDFTPNYTRFVERVEALVTP